MKLIAVLSLASIIAQLSTLTLHNNNNLVTATPAHGKNHHAFMSMDEHQPHHARQLTAPSFEAIRQLAQANSQKHKNQAQTSKHDRWRQQHHSNHRVVEIEPFTQHQQKHQSKPISVSSSQQNNTAPKFDPITFHQQIESLLASVNALHAKTKAVQKQQQHANTIAQIEKHLDDAVQHAKDANASKAKSHIDDDAHNDSHDDEIQSHCADALKKVANAKMQLQSKRQQLMKQQLKQTKDNDQAIENEFKETEDELSIQHHDEHELKAEQELAARIHSQLQHFKMMKNDEIKSKSNNEIDAEQHDPIVVVPMFEFEVDVVPDDEASEQEQSKDKQLDSILSNVFKCFL
jgi:hypothetical protein